MSDHEPRVFTVPELGATIIKWGTVIAMIFAGATYLWKISDKLSTDAERTALETHLLDNHDHDISQVIETLGAALAPIQKSLESTETDALVSRITNLLNIRCQARANNATFTLQDILDEQKDRYSSLNNDRVFGDGRCVDGARVAQ